MTKKHLILFILCHIVLGSSADEGPECEQELQKCSADFLAYRSTVSEAMKRIFDPDETQICESSPGCDKRLIALQGKLARTQKVLAETREELKVARDTPPRIFMSAHQEVKAFHWNTKTAVRVKQNTETLYGIAHDPSQHRIYWSSANVIYRGDKDDDAMKIVFESHRYGTINGLAFDWVTQNLYGVSSNGIVFGCNTTAGPMLHCMMLVSGQGNVFGIAVNPYEGKMYWTRNGYIVRSDMDGSSVQTIVSSLSYPRGIVIDYTEGRIYWADDGNDSIRSSTLTGSDQRTIYGTTDPWGIAILNDRIFFGNTGSGIVYSMTKTGSGLMVLHDGPAAIYHLVLADYSLSQNRTDQCETLNCSRLCVLKASSATCVF